MRFPDSMLLAAVILAAAGCGRAQTRKLPLMADTVAARESTPIRVALPSLGGDRSFPRSETPYGENLSPPVDWTPVRGAAAYALIIQDPDAHGPRPFVHWLVWNIPASLSRLPEGAASHLSAIAASAAQGRNDAGSTGYFGPHPPAGSGLHHYHVQVFALASPLPLAAGAAPGAVEGALQGHVVAKGEAIGVVRAGP